MTKKLLDFQASISDVKQINPTFSTCKVRVLYTGKNRNMSIITKDSVEKALPTLKNIPIVGEYSEENKDYKGHGGAINLDDYKFIHTTKPYGVVPESATYQWEEVKGRDGSIREYLTIYGCYLWTGRYEEAFSVIESGKGQSMEIEVTDGRWDEDQEAYQIDNFIFTALCILGDDVEPAFEDANITAYSLDKDTFRAEFTALMKEVKALEKEEEVDEMLKALLEKYSLKVEDLTAKGINFNEISEDELEAKIIEAFGEVEENTENSNEGTESEGEENQEPETNVEPEGETVEGEGEGDQEPEGEGQVELEEDNTVESEAEQGEDPEAEQAQTVTLEEGETVLTSDEAEAMVDVDALNARIAELEGELDKLKKDNTELVEFKLNVKKKDHEDKVQKMFKDFQLTQEDVEGLDIHKYSVEEIEEKCYAIIGKKLASKKNFNKQENEGGIRLPLGNEKTATNESPYGGLFDKYNK